MAGPTLTASLSQPATFIMCDRMDLDAARTLLGAANSSLGPPLEQAPQTSHSFGATTALPETEEVPYTTYAAAEEDLQKKSTLLSPSSSLSTSPQPPHSFMLQHGQNNGCRQVPHFFREHHNHPSPPHHLEEERSDLELFQSHKQQPTHCAHVGIQQLEHASMTPSKTTSTTENFVYRRPRSDSAGLDALAALATKETLSQELRAGASSESPPPLAPFLVSRCCHPPSEDSDADDDDAAAEAAIAGSLMPPPTRRGRPRSASNPEGMEKWDSLKTHRKLDTGRRHFVLPASILEEELQAVSAVMREREQQQQQENQLQQRHNRRNNTSIPRSIPEDEELITERSSSSIYECNENEEKEEEVDEASLTPEELLRRARARLLEDLSESNIDADKGDLTLPHSLAKYKEVYNKNGRIGIYTPAERAAIIAKFNGKRTRRVWNKKIRYNCRKSLADRRLRVKGRFVKRSEQEQLAKELAKKAAEADDNGGKDEFEADGCGEDDDLNQQQEMEEDEAMTSATPNAKSSEDDDDMPDMDDPDAGFDPTDDQPYRRLRRHTIT